METVKETKAQRIERLKREKDGLDVIEDIVSVAQNDGVADADMMDRLKWYGLYLHNRNASPDEKQYFMLRVKVPGGRLSVEQLKVLADISREYARESADITVRQSVQFHWLEMKNIPEVFAKLDSVGLTTKNASGDGLRSIVGCPLEGITDDAYCDVREIKQRVNDFFQGNYAYSNLPRKYKVGISSCRHHCMNHEIQDLGFTAFETAEQQILFDVTMGGGLSSNTSIARRLGCITKEQIFAVCVAVGTLFRDHGNRENRQRARIGHLLAEWGVDRVRAFIEDQVGFKFLPYAEPQISPDKKRSHMGIQPAKKTGYVHLGCVAIGGRLKGRGLQELCDICTLHGGSGLVLTPDQNFILTDLPAEAVTRVQQTVKNAGFISDPSPFRAGSLACTGLQYCKFAISETKDKEEELVKYLEQRFPDFSESISISLSGCPHACSHSNVVDLGFAGCLVQEKKGVSPGFQFFKGGKLQGETGSSFTQKTSVKVSSDQLCRFVGDLIESYLNDGNSTTFRAFLQQYAFPALSN